MRDASTRPAPRRKTPWFPATRVPRPFDKWLYEILHGPEWEDCDLRMPWLVRLREIAEEHGCGIRFDTRRHWMESVYVMDFKGCGPTVLIGGAGESIDVCTVLLHELGHHLVTIRQQRPARVLENEVAAWKTAHELASEHRLPLNPRVRRIALYSYRYAMHLKSVGGSKKRNRNRPDPHSWRLEGSKRSASVRTGYGTYSTGKKGKRHTKRHIKEATRRAERRKPVDEE